MESIEKGIKETTSSVIIKTNDSNEPMTVSNNLSSSTISADAKNENFLNKLRHNSEYRIRYLHTCFAVWMYTTSGWNVSIIGATFPDLRLIIQKDLDTASWIFTISSLGYLVGALVGGLLFDRINRLLMLAAIITLNGVTIAAFPWCSTFPAMLAISFVNSLISSGIDVGGNSHVASIWGQDAAPFMQAIHFGFSFGGIISPLTAESFLAPKYCPEVSIENTSNATTMSVTNVTMESDGDCEEVYGKTNIHYAYLIAGFVSLSAAVPFLSLYLLSSKYNTYVNTPMASTNTSKGNTMKDLPVLSLFKRVFFVTLLMLLISSYGCTESRFSALVATFVTGYLNWSTRDGIHITSLFWATLAGGRFLGVAVTRFLKTPTMILIYFIFLAATLVSLFFAAKYDIGPLVWACAALAGLSMSVILPSIFTWTAESILTISGTISAVYFIGVSVFSMIASTYYGYLMENYSMMYFVELLLGQCIVCLCLYSIIRILISNIK